MLHTVKTEKRPVWEWPIPQYIDLSGVPPEITHPRAVERPLTPKDYVLYFGHKVGTMEPHYLRHEVYPLIVCQEVEKVPGIWQIKARTNPTNHDWAKVAVGIYERTGEIMAIATIRKMWNLKKTNLKCRIKRAFNKRKIPEEELEEKLWEYGADYAVLRFYRRQTQAMEKAAREEGLYKYVTNEDGTETRVVSKVFELDDSDDEDAQEARLMVQDRADEGVYVEHEHIEAPMDPGPSLRAEQERVREQAKASTFSRTPSGAAESNGTPRKRRSADALIPDTHGGPPRARVPRMEPPVERSPNSVLAEMLSTPEVRQHQQMLRMQEQQQQPQQNQPPQRTPQAPLPTVQGLPPITPAQLQTLQQKATARNNGVRGVRFSPLERQYLEHFSRVQQHQQMMQQQMQSQQGQAFNPRIHPPSYHSHQMPPPPAYHQPPPQPLPAVSKHQAQVNFLNTLISNFVTEHPDRVVLMTSVIQNTLDLLSGDLNPDTEQTEVFQMLSERYPNYIQRYK